VVPPLKQIKEIMGAVMPARISKFLPAKVINSGTALFRNSQYNTNSTGIRTILNTVRVRKSILLINLLPALVANNKMIVSSGGATAKIKRGGNPEVSLKNPLYANIPVNASHTMQMIVTRVLFFVDFINNHNVNNTVATKITVT
jgi:hypothetical protein